MQDFIVNLFQGALDNLNYWWIILFMAIESSFIPFPSEIVMIPAAYKAYQHPDEMSFLMIIICGTIGALIGALVNYVLSYFLGRPIVYGFAIRTEILTGLPSCNHCLPSTAIGIPTHAGIAQ